MLAARRGSLHKKANPVGADELLTGWADHGRIRNEQGSELLSATSIEVAPVCLQ
jgi:hypothetical protein